MPKKVPEIHKPKTSISIDLENARLLVLTLTILLTLCDVLGPIVAKVDD